MSTLVVIPARLGSKGLPRKNVRILGSKPLVAYSIEFAQTLLSSEDHICISTNDQEVIEIAESLGVTPDFSRSDKLSNDKASMYDVLVDAVMFYEKRDMFFEKLLLLQPTSPFREVEDYLNLKHAFQLGCQMAVSVSESKENPYFTLVEETENGFIEKSKPSDFVRRQDCPSVYALNGSMYLISIESLKQKGSLNFDQIRISLMPKERSVDIDDIHDFKYAEYLLMNNK